MLRVNSKINRQKKDKKFYRESNNYEKSENWGSPESLSLEPFSIDKVKVAGEIGRRINLTVYQNLLVLNIESDFLAPFRERNRTSGYIGLGKLIDCIVKFAVYTHDDKIRELKGDLVSEIIKTQESDGYIGILVPASRVWGMYDIHEMSYIILGLVNDFKHFGEKASLSAAIKLADYILFQWSSAPDRIPGPSGKRNKMYGVTTGLDGALLALYEQTEDRKYLDFLFKFERYKLPQWNAKIKMDIPGKARMDDERHAYIYMALCVAQLQLYKFQPDRRLLKQTKRALDFLIRQDGLLISGSCGLNEAWDNSQSGNGKVSESCATAYLIRMLDSLLQITGDVQFGNMMERAVYNALFAAQSPDGRKLRYFCPLNGERPYYTSDTFCCPNNFRRIIAELPGMIYYRSGNGLAINLYTPSTAEIDLEGGRKVKIRQETDYPNSGFVKIFIMPPEAMAFSLQLRIPKWCQKATLMINGETATEILPKQNFYQIHRTWNPEDFITIDMTMPWRLIRGYKTQKGKAALMRGPMVYCVGSKNNPALLQDAEKLETLVIDPASLGMPVADTSVRPDGLKVSSKIRLPQEGSYIAEDVILSEFPEPSGLATYFHIPDITRAMDDELIDIKQENKLSKKIY